VQLCPIQHQLQRPPWEFTLDNAKPSNLDRRLEVPVNCVKVRWCLITEKHANQNSVELADCGHARALPISYWIWHYTVLAPAAPGLSNCLTSLKSANDRAYSDLMARRLVDLGSDALVAHLLLLQAEKDPVRAVVAEKFIHDALPRIRMQADYITSGDRLTIDKRAELI
jgi:hypothetical protein